MMPLTWSDGLEEILTWTIEMAGFSIILYWNGTNNQNGLVSWDTLSEVLISFSGGNGDGSPWRNSGDASSEEGRGDALDNLGSSHIRGNPYVWFLEKKGLVTAPPYSTCDMKLYKWIRDLEYSRMECLSIDKPSRNRPWIGRVWKPMGASLVTGCAKRWEVYWQRRMHSCCRLNRISMVKWNELMINLVISRRRNAVVRLTKMVKLLVGTTNQLVSFQSKSSRGTVNT